MQSVRGFGIQQRLRIFASNRMNRNQYHRERQTANGRDEMYRENTVRTILAAPGVGMIHGTYGADETLLYDRQANGDAFPGEHIVRVPRRFVRHYHGRWCLQNSMLKSAAACAAYHRDRRAAGVKWKYPR